MTAGSARRAGRTDVAPLLLAALALALAPAAGCRAAKPPVVDFSDVSRSYSSDDYGRVYRRWTRHDTVIHEVESALEVWATYKSMDFREAFVAHYAAAYSLNDADRERLMQSQREAAAASYEFLVTTQSANYRWNDLEKKNSAWRVTLLDGAGHEIVPEELKIQKLPDIFEHEFFPVKTPFTKTFVARFSRTAGKDDGFVGDKTGRITLRFGGPLGHADLTWSSRAGREVGPAE